MDPPSICLMMSCWNLYNPAAKQKVVGIAQWYGACLACIGSWVQGHKKQDLAKKGAGETAEGLKEFILLWAGSSPSHVG